MKILVTVKQVPDTSGKVSVKPDGTLDRGSMKTIINPDDLNAVDTATGATTTATALQKAVLFAKEYYDELD